MADLDAVAAALLDACASRRPIPPLTETCEGLTLDDAAAAKSAGLPEPEIRRTISSVVRTAAPHGFDASIRDRGTGAEAAS